MWFAQGGLFCCYGRGLRSSCSENRSLVALCLSHLSTEAHIWLPNEAQWDTLSPMPFIFFPSFPISAGEGTQTQTDNPSLPERTREERNSLTWFSVSTFHSFHNFLNENRCCYLSFVMCFFPPTHLPHPLFLYSSGTLFLLFFFHQKTSSISQRGTILLDFSLWDSVFIFSLPGSSWGWSRSNVSSHNIIEFSASQRAGNRVGVGSPLVLQNCIIWGALV